MEVTNADVSIVIIIYIYILYTASIFRSHHSIVFINLYLIMHSCLCVLHYTVHMLWCILINDHNILNQNINLYLILYYCLCVFYHIVV